MDGADEYSLILYEFEEKLVLEVVWMDTTKQYQPNWFGKAIHRLLYHHIT